MLLAGDMGRGISDAFKQVEQATRGITSGTFTVTKDNVLAAARIIESQVDELQDSLMRAGTELKVNPPGSDDVSVRMAAAWNDLLIDNDDSYRSRITEYIVGLRKLAIQLGDSAKAYGFTEEEIAEAFGRRSA